MNIALQGKNFYNYIISLRIYYFTHKINNHLKIFSRLIELIYIITKKEMNDSSYDKYSHDSLTL